MGGERLSRHLNLVTLFLAVEGGLEQVDARWQRLGRELVGGRLHHLLTRHVI